MSEKENINNIIQESNQQAEAHKYNLYLHSLRKMAEQNLEQSRSPMTDLYNVRAFFYKSDELAMLNPEHKWAMIVLDIAQFKSVNEFCGRAAGDDLLRFIASHLRRLEIDRPKTCACHMRADIFALFTSYEQEEELVEIVNSLEKEIDEYPINCKVLPAFGICTSETNTTSSSYLKDCATMAMKTIKGKFYASYAFFDEKMRREMLREKQIENDIVESLKNRDFSLYIQPKVDMSTGKIIGGEALVRWIHPEHGMIQPGEFIPILEKNGFIINLDVYMWGQVFEFINTLLSEGIEPVPISINVSRVHVYDKSFCKTLCDMCDTYRVAAKYVPLELTESAFLGDEQGMYERMKMLRDMGFKLSMDDFGTGYSSMIMLKNLPMDEIKVDKAFISDMNNDKSKVVVQHTISMLRDLETSIIVEGVETEEQRDFLIGCGCDQAQGFLFYKPMPAEEFKKLLMQASN